MPVRAPVSALVPEKYWVEFELPTGPSYPQILDQDGYGACNGHAAISSLEWARWLVGMSYIALSPWYVYVILCNGIDRGSSIEEALDLLCNKGTSPASAVPYGTINPAKIPPTAPAVAWRPSLLPTVGRSMPIEPPMPCRRIA